MVALERSEDVTQATNGCGGVDHVAAGDVSGSSLQLLNHPIQIESRNVAHCVKVHALVDADAVYRHNIRVVELAAGGSSLESQSVALVSRWQTATFLDATVWRSEICSAS